MIGYKKWNENPFSSDNTQGVLNFGIAENHLVENEILELLEDVKLPAKYIHYSPLYGIDELREAFVKYSKEHLKIDLHVDQIVTQCGVSALCESLSYILFDEHDEILIPAPYYTGFKYDFEARFKCKLVPVELENFIHSVDQFEKNISKNTKAILLTNPHNPLGSILSEQVLREFIDLSEKHGLHLISDEVYAMTRNSKTDFTSIMQIDSKYQNIHMLYGMAKDFTLAGLKCGYFISKNETVVNAMKQVSYFHPVSTQTQLTISQLLINQSLSTFFEKSYHKISLNLQKITDHCKLLSIHKPNSGIFFLADFRKHLSSQSFKAETELFQYFINGLKINITPGKELGLKTPGYFRICYARKEIELDEFIKRMNNFLESH